MVSTFSDESDECQLAQSLFDGICGCPPVKETGYCTFCPNDEYIPDTERVLKFLDSREGGPLLTCSEMNWTLTQVDHGSNHCFLSRSYGFLCGCDDGERYYFGADIELKRAFIAWIPRVTGFFSMVGSLWIIFTVMRDRSKRNLMYNQLMLNISLFDCISSAGWILSTAPIPEYENGEPTGIYGAIGNTGTCSAQGFIVQFGMIGSVTVSALLSLYFLLIIVKSYREWHFKGIRKWFHVTPFVLALSWALAGLPYYDYVFLLCHVTPYPVADSHAQSIVFILIPIALSWLVCCFNMIWIYWKVRKQSVAAERWRMMGRGRTHLSHHQSQDRQSSGTTAQPSNSLSHATTVDETATQTSKTSSSICTFFSWPCR